MKPVPDALFQLAAAKKEILQSPLNYTGGKYKLLPQILPLFPGNISTFADLFCGGCNVGINVNADRVIFNDREQMLSCLFQTLRNLDKDETFRLIDGIIAKYGLSDSSRNDYAKYGADSSAGLGSYNKENFLKMRHDFNYSTPQDYYFYIMLYVIVVYSFNNQIRFNSQGKFNLPVGKRDFNQKMREKLSLFIDRLKEGNYQFSCKDFRDFKTDVLDKDSLVYCDPPYLITCASYNENSQWTEQDEKDLLQYLDALDSEGIRFALSNVLEHKGRKNTLLMEWTKKYNIIHLDFDYSNSNYHAKNTDKKTQEALITNY